MGSKVQGPGQRYCWPSPRQTAFCEVVALAQNPLLARRRIDILIVSCYLPFFTCFTGSQVYDLASVMTIWDAPLNSINCNLPYLSSFPPFFTVQLSHPYMTNGKTIALTRRNFVDKVMCLLFNMLSRLLITFLSRSKHLLITLCLYLCAW